jgi:spermidine/putrescine-binding protein
MTPAKLFRVVCFTLALGLSWSMPASSQSADSEKILNIYNWADYFRTRYARELHPQVRYRHSLRHLRQRQ